MEKLIDLGQAIMVALPTIVAIGWSIEKILRLLNTITPKEWKWDDNLADILGKTLKAIAGKNKSTTPPAA